MIDIPESKRHRKRGVILTVQGLEKLQNAKAEAEYKENKGNKYTLEALSERTALAIDTLMKVFAAESGVDKRTLKLCFKAFNLTLEPDDYCPPTLEEVIAPDLEHPGGQVPLDSPFYVERFPLESNCYKAILKPVALIRIKAPRRMGKTSLMARILQQAKRNNFHAVSLSFRLADHGVFQNLDRLLQWFCAYITLNLKLENQVSEYWDDSLGSKMSCTLYFEAYLLTHLHQPLVLGLDDVDRIFNYPELADDFFALLRAWHEEAKNREIWRKLRLIVAHSTELYIPVNINQSPFNIGLPIELSVFNAEQILDLSAKYNLNWSLKEAEKLSSFVGGNPYLVRLTMYHLCKETMNLETLLNFDPFHEENVYTEHLNRQVWTLQQSQEQLLETFAKVVMSDQPVEIDLVKACYLHSLGLIRFQGNTVTTSCELYHKYFQDYFKS